MESAHHSARMVAGKATFEVAFRPRIGVSISGSTAPEGAQVDVTSMALGSSRPPGTKSVTFPKSAAFFDVLIQGISDGKARLCITDASVEETSVMKYWKGNDWVEADNKAVDRDTICADVSVSDLNRTPIVIGT